ncbi:MAG: tol-pal system protein YbgF [Rhizobiales bacterium]|nr:tol-pal system protein YbgF [Hyphomicrobiales bacterium]
MRQLVGQVEELTFQLRTLQQQIGTQRSGDAGQMPVTSTKRMTVAEMPAAGGNIEPMGQGGGQFEDEQQVTTIVTENGTEEQVVLQKAPGPKILGTLPGSGYDGSPQVNFNGQVIVPAEGGGGQMPSEVETVSLGTQAETPDALYERSYESLLRRQFADAETGFRTFVQKYGDNSLAGNAQYWLGETYYVQGDYRQAAQSFLKGYREYPKSRKAADSLLKLGLSLNRLGQKEQACAAFTQLGSQFPKAAEARKRAQTEAKRAGCAA